MKTGNYPIIGATNWEANEIGYKPNTGVDGFGIDYDYRPAAAIGQRCFVYQGSLHLPERAVTDIHESMSFVARPRSDAAGANPSVGGAIDDRYNLGAGSKVNLGNSESDHGGAFNRRIQQIWPYYRELGVRLHVLTLE